MCSQKKVDDIDCVPLFHLYAFIYNTEPDHYISYHLNQSISTSIYYYRYFVLIDDIEWNFATNYYIRSASIVA